MTALSHDCFEALAAAYEAAGSYAATGKLLATAAKPQGYSAGAVCALLSGNYKANLKNAEAAIRANLKICDVYCPVLGEIDRCRCLTEQKRPFRAVAPAIALWRACRGGCPHYIKEDNDAECQS